MPSVDESLPAIAESIRSASERESVSPADGAGVRRFWIGAGPALALLAAITLPWSAATRAHAWPWWALARGLLLLAPVLLWVSAQRRTSAPMAAGAEHRLARLWAWALGGLAGVYVLSAVLSAHPQESGSAASIIVALVCFVAGLARQLTALPVLRRHVAWILAIGGVVFALDSLLLWWVRSAGPMIAEMAARNAAFGAEIFHLHPDGFRNSQPLGHSNYTAGVTLLVLPWVIGAAVRMRGWRRFAWTLAVLLVFGTLVSSGSRGAVLGLASGGGFALILGARAAGWSRRHFACALLVLVLGLGGLVAGIPRVRNSVVRLVQGDHVTVGDQQRLAMTQIGLAMGADRWWIGQGPGLSTRLYPSYRHTVEGGVDMAMQLHSTPVHVWAETGLPGMVAMAALCGLALWGAVRGIGRARVRDAAPATEDGGELWIVAAAGVSLAGYAAFAVTDYQLDLPVVAALVGANLAVLSGPIITRRSLTRPGDNGSRRGVEASPPSGSAFDSMAGVQDFEAAPGAASSVPARARTGARVTGWAGIAALAAGIAITVPEWRARSTMAGAVAALERGGDEGVFNAGMLRAADHLPDNPDYPLGAAAAYLRLGFTEGDHAARARHLALARTFLARALDVRPDLEFAHTNLAWLSLHDDPAEAAEHFRRTLHLLPDRAGGYFGLGLAWLEQGDVSRAREAMALEVVNDPVFLSAPAWDTPLLAPHREPVARRAQAIAANFAAEPDSPQAASSRYVAALLAWWLGDDAAAGPAHAAASETTARAFFATLAGGKPAPWDGRIRTDTPGWQVIEAVASVPAHRRDRLAQFLFARRRTPATDHELDVLEKVVERCGTDWRAWLNAPEGRDAPFVKTYRRDRGAYTVIVRNPDMPIALDAYLVQENQLVEWFFGDLFPPRGWAPDRLLLRHLAENEL